MPDETDIYPALDHIAITPSDVTTYDNPRLRGLFVGTAGTVSVKCNLTGAIVSYTMPAGGILPINVYQVRATGTAAGNIVGWI